MVLGDVPMEIGIGLHTGRAILGNLGSRTKMEYTAIGDTVNTAARLQELTKHFEEYPLIMSRNVFDNIERTQPFYKNIINLGLHEIRGKKDTLEVFGFNNYTACSLPIPGDDEGLEPVQIMRGV